MAYSLTGLSGFGTIISEDSGKDSSLFQQPIPLSDSSSAILLDLFGASRRISIKGVYTSADGTIATFIGELDGLIDGEQTAKTYHSDKSGLSYTVLVDHVSWNVEEGEVNKVNYTIELIEGTS